MQNPHIEDLNSGDGKREGYSKCVYIRKWEQDRINLKIATEGYVLIGNENDLSDLVLLGIPEKTQDVEKTTVKKTAKKK